MWSRCLHVVYSDGQATPCMGRCLGVVRLVHGIVYGCMVCWGWGGSTWIGDVGLGWLGAVLLVMVRRY